MAPQVSYEQVWMHEIQPKLARLSTRGRQIIIAKSGHHIPDEAPEEIVRSVREVFVTIRFPIVANVEAARSLRPKQTRIRAN